MSTDRTAATHPDQLADLSGTGASFPLGRRLTTLVAGDLALCGSTADGVGRTQVARRQPDGTWLRVLDRPNPTPEG